MIRCFDQSEAYIVKERVFAGLESKGCIVNDEENIYAVFIGDQDLIAFHRPCAGDCCVKERGSAGAVRVQGQGHHSASETGELLHVQRGVGHLQYPCTAKSDGMGGIFGGGVHAYVVQVVLLCIGLAGRAADHGDEQIIGRFEEHILADGGQAGGQIDLPEVCAAGEGFLAQGGQPFGQGDLGQGDALMEGLALNLRQLGRQGNGRQLLALAEGRLLDAGEGIRQEDFFHSGFTEHFGGCLRDGGRQSNGTDDAVLIEQLGLRMGDGVALVVGGQTQIGCAAIVAVLVFFQADAAVFMAAVGKPVRVIMGDAVGFCKGHGVRAILGYQHQLLGTHKRILGDAADGGRNGQLTDGGILKCVGNNGGNGQTVQGFGKADHRIAAMVLDDRLLLTCGDVIIIPFGFVFRQGDTLGGQVPLPALTFNIGPFVPFFVDDDGMEHKHHFAGLGKGEDRLGGFIGLGVQGQIAGGGDTVRLDELRKAGNGLGNGTGGGWGWTVDPLR